MTMVGNDCGDAVFAVINQSGMNAAEKAALKVEIRKIYSALVTYIIANLGIKGVEVSDPAGTVEAYVAAVGSNGGVLNASLPTIDPVSGNVKKAAQTHTQNNDGTGLVE